MAQQDDESTASDTSDTTTIDVSTTPVDVSWEKSTLLHVMKLSVGYNASAGTGFFTMRTSIELKGAFSENIKTTLYLIIPPNRIRTLTLLTADENEDHAGPINKEMPRKKKPKRTRWSLHFTLHNAGVVDFVGPKVAHLTPKNRGAGHVLDSLRLLARQSSFQVHLAPKVLSKSRWLLLCKAVSESACQPMVGKPDIDTLYGGEGGQHIELGVGAPDTEAHLTRATNLDPSLNPPSYDSLEPRQPLPHMAAEGSSVATGDFSDYTKKKRRRISSDGESDAEAGFQSHGVTNHNLVLPVIRKMLAELKSEILADMERSLPTIIEQKMWPRIAERIDSRVADEMELVQQQLDEHRDGTQDLIDDLVDDQCYRIKEDLKEYVEEGELKSQVVAEVLDKIEDTGLYVQFVRPNETMNR
ncbi:uncharacterized protein BCR38DRAFT_486012 [Pseudomassariella vexata]|uniref:Uncharacterized protein n=1 Tax=Pseudomassariella vexata TaxID=1141098 RepID=A0A1Y2DVI6_9PEZI|nr:uncharacterized protein BCR38DRAFT_486012 [Pseudomassariella vexata]ORY63263.1 hypothetical protein BCR38DRAFT_486012 [Pseudomassariella vexata]